MKNNENSENKVLLKGNEALAESAVRAGCRYYFGYPITPQNEIPEYMSFRLPEVGGVFVQAESELASINMLLGAGSCGVRAMTSSSSPGISLMQEGLSYMAGSEVPGVIVNMMRGGPGLGNIAPGQADYFQSVKCGGNGDYKLIVLAPSGVQEIADLTPLSFELAMKYRNPVMILGDGILGQMFEPVTLPEMKELSSIDDKTAWACGNKKDQTIMRSLYLVPENRLEMHNIHLQEKYSRIADELSMFEEYKTEDAEYLICAYGSTARVCREAVDGLRESGIKIGLFRPITLWPFPYKIINRAADRMKKVFVFELAHAQFEEDIRLAVDGKREIKGFYKMGGAIFTEEEIIYSIKESIR